MSSYPPNSGDNFGTRTYSRGATTGGAYPETTTFDVGTTSPTSNPPWTAPTTAYPPRTNASNVNDTSDDAAIAALLQAEEDYYTSTAASRAKAPPVPVAAGVPSAVTAPYYLSANSTRAAPAAIELTPMSSTPSAASSGTTLNGSVSPYQGATVDLDADSWKAAYDAAGIPLQRPKVNVPLPNEPTKPWWRSGWFLCVAAILVCIAVLIPVLLITTGVIKVYPTPAKPPPVWIDWYNATGARAAPNCSLLATPSSQQPTFADFDTPMPDQPVASMQQVINMNNDYGLDETAPDNFPFLQKALTDCKGTNPWQGCRLTMRRGIYRFTSERPLFFDRLVNFTLDGNSSIFLFSRRSVFSRLTAFDSCRSVKIVNLQMDWDWSIWRLASLVQIDAVQATQPGSLGQQILRMRFLDHPMLDMSTINGLQDMHAVDPSTLTVGVRDTNRFGQYWSLDNHVLAMEQSWDKEKVTNNTVTVTLDKALTPPPDVGGLYLIRHFTYEGHALQFAKCSDFWIDNVKVWGAPGMALAVHPGSSDFRVTNFTVGILGNSTLENVTRIVNETVPGFFNVTLLPTSNSTLGLRNSTNVTVSHISLPALSRRISTTADGLNFIGTTGHIHVEDAEVGFQGDDCANANPPIVLGISRSSESDSGSRIVLRDWQSLRMGTIEEGNQLEFRNPDFSPTGVIRKVRGQPYWTQGAGWNVDIEGPKLPVLGDGWVGANGERWLGTDPTVIVFNLKYNATSSLLFRRLHCHSNRSRGILFQVPVGVIEHSCFSNIQKRALSVTAEVQAGSWAEGMGVRELVFAGNKVEKCDKLDDYLGLAWTGVFSPDGTISSYPLLQGITIINNTFINFPRRSIMIDSASGVEVSGNRIINNESNEPQTPERGQIYVAKSRNVAINGNTWSTGQYTGATLVRTDQATTSGVDVGGDNVVV